MDWLYRISTGFRARHWNKASRRSVTHLPWKGWGQVRRIGILFDAHNHRADLEALRAVVTELKTQQRTVTLCGWTGQMRPKNVLYNGRQLIFMDDFTWKGQAESGNALEFVQTEFDVLICLHRSPGSPLDELAAQAPAGMRIGGAGDQDFYDLCMLPESKDYIAYVKSLGNWLSKIAPNA
ncbi:MAG: hypothetical protein P8N56_04810 [Schleiferiaceae bacterium]|nr:hypothetical protein [Schleiferiaceae bacterium]